MVKNRGRVREKPGSTKRHQRDADTGRAVEVQTFVGPIAHV